MQQVAPVGVGQPVAAVIYGGVIGFGPFDKADMLLIHITAGANPFAKALILLSLIHIFARIPSIITSTFAGSAIDNEKWLEMILIFIITGAVAVLGIVFNDKIIAFFSRNKHHEMGKAENHPK